METDFRRACSFPRWSEEKRKAVGERRDQRAFGTEWFARKATEVRSGIFEDLSLVVQ